MTIEVIARRPRRCAPTAAALLLFGALLAGCRTAAVDPAVIGDAQTAARVKTALVNDPDVGTEAIEVTVIGGVARLTGRVRSQAVADRAVAIARGVEGVSEVRAELLVGAAAAPADDGAAAPSSRFLDDLEPDPPPGLLAVGASLGWSVPRHVQLDSRTAVGPLIKLGSGRGLGLAVGFDWFTSDVEIAGGGESPARVHVRPLMAGLSYTVRAGRVSVSPSLVAGYALNSLSITGTGPPGTALVVEVDNSFVWRPGMSAWIDLRRRWAVNASVGYVLTGLHFTVLEANRLVKRPAGGDTLVVHGGLAYKLF
ncbi:MAG TPA: BON domain-containing protein [Vicinamibacterales bacterium]|nr:BON domain-containing protein [Vicinamibacterales bacterium]